MHAISRQGGFLEFSFSKMHVSKERTRLAKTALKEHEIDALVFFDGDKYGRKFALTIAYTALVLFSDKDPIILAHSIEKDHAESESPLEIAELKDTSKLKGTLDRLLPKRKGEKRKVAIVPWNARYEKVEALRQLNCEIADASKNILPQCLKKPLPEELDAIRKLSSVCDAGLDAADITIEPGRREFEISAEVDYAVEKLGATEFSFPTLVASGYRAAFLHGWTSHRRISEGDTVVVDIGPVLGGYDGCICRTFTAGGSSKWKKEIEVVQEAIHDSLEILKNQKTASGAQIDKVARQEVREHGYRKWPNMKSVWTGHPIGGFASPIIAPCSKDEIEEGMVFAIEPGIYVKGKGGVRIEHHILAKKYDYEILDEFPESP